MIDTPMSIVLHPNEYPFFPPDQTNPPLPDHQATVSVPISFLALPLLILALPFFKMALTPPYDISTDTLKKLSAAFVAECHAVSVRFSLPQIVE